MSYTNKFTRTNKRNTQVEVTKKTRLKQKIISWLDENIVTKAQTSGESKFEA